MVSTGANLYHDIHFGMGLEMHRGSPNLDDRELRDEGVVRIYDILFDYDVLVETDNFIKKVVGEPEFQTTMSSAEFHYRLGAYVLERERASVSRTSLWWRRLTNAAFRYIRPLPETVRSG